MAEDPLKEQSAKLLAALDFASQAAALEEEHEQRLLGLLRSLFEVVDSFDRLLTGGGGTEAGAGEGAWRGTVQRIAGQLERALEQAGVTEIRCLGTVADPGHHEIVEVQPMDGVDDDTILEVLSRGWEWNGRPVRRPRVLVARSPKEIRT
jgi:molecular chaperone GrpE (heat shock protein)